MRIGIVNDLPMAVEALRRVVALKSNHRVIWVARNGVEAVDLCAKETPDLVLMDLIMPEMDGVQATRRIMARTPCAIVIVTVSVGANVGQVFEAMGHGALDAVDTPAVGAGDPHEGAAPLLAKIELIGRLLGVRDRDQGPAEFGLENGRASEKTLLVAIGASAGGPAALATVLGGLPKEFPAAVVVIQHVDEQFAAGMAAWLSGSSRLPVRVAREGDSISVGTVSLAGTGDHLTVKGDGRLGYTPNPRDQIYRPSVDVFFQSISQFWVGGVVGVVLTGMGSDGAVGLKTLRNKGYYTIAQDKATSAVYGMPKAAVALNAAVDILPLSEIASKLLSASRHGLATVYDG
jgi:two-component system, chemotaxis family, response regulator WspF